MGFRWLLCSGRSTFLSTVERDMCRTSLHAQTRRITGAIVVRIDVPSDLPQVTVRVNEKTKERWSLVARERGVSLSRLITQAMDKEFPEDDVKDRIRKARLALSEIYAPE